jgi:hypothetical protein
MGVRELRLPDRRKTGTSSSGPDPIAFRIRGAILYTVSSKKKINVTLSTKY